MIAVEQKSTKKMQLWVLITCIFAAQFATTAILDNLFVLSRIPWIWRTFYSALSFVAAIPQAGFSDVKKRKTHLLISIGAISTASIYSLILTCTVSSTTTLSPMLIELPICLVLGALGNAIPIARGCIVVLETTDFRSSIGYTTAAIGLGWVFPNIPH